MERRLYILLVFASIAQTEYVPELQVYYGLTAEQVPVLNQIRVNQYVAGNIHFNGFKTIFEVLCRLGTNSNQDCSKVFEALIGMEKAADLSFDSIHLIMNDSYSAVEEARQSLHEYVHNAAVQIRAACKLAISGNYWETPDEIEIHRTSLKKVLKNMVESFYSLISTCSNTQYSGALVVTKSAQKRSYVNGLQFNDAFFNAIEFGMAKTSDVCKDRNFLTDMKDFENKALFAVEQYVKYKFTTLSTFYMAAGLRRNEILPQLAANQYALSESLRGYQDGDDIFYYTIIRYLKYIHLGIDDDGKLDFSRDDGSIAEAIAHYDAGDSSNLASILLLHPKSYSEIAAVREILFDMNAAGTQGLFNLIHAAIVPGANYSQVMDNIGTARDEVAVIARNFAENYFIIIRNNQSFNEKLDTELKKLLKKTTDNLAVALNAYLDAVVILANAAHRGKVSKDDISAVLVCRDAGSEGNDKYTQGISAASFLVLLTQNDNKQG